MMNIHDSGYKKLFSNRTIFRQLLETFVNHEGVRKLPAVFPIVLYNGEARWTAPVVLSELIEGTPPLGAFALDFQYFLIAENQYSQQALLKIRNIVSTLFLAESHYDLDVLEAELLNLFSSESDKQAVSLFLHWFRQLALHGRIASEDYESLETVYRNEEEVKTMLVTALEREKQQIYQTGLVEGEKKGLLEGKTEREIEVAKAMLSEGMEIGLISRITALS